MDVRGIRATLEMPGMPKAALKLGSVWPLPVEFCRSHSRALGNCDGNAGRGLGYGGAAVMVGVKGVDDMALEDVLLNFRVGFTADVGECPLDGVG